MNLSLIELVNFARIHSPFYCRWYSDVPLRGWQFADLPVVDPAAFWRGVDSPDCWPALTGPIGDGYLFKTGGSSGDGKLSVYTRAEWATFTLAFGQQLAARLRPGDRVANLFFAGDMYASFLFIHHALRASEVPVCELPLTGQIDPVTLAHSIAMYQVTVLAGLPAQFVAFSDWLERNQLTLPTVQRLLYGGESLHDDQRERIARVFPKATVASIGCASVDAGLIGISNPCDPPGVHRSFADHTHLEILDEASGKRIEAPNQPGLLVVTNLFRTLMPIIRFPTGDLACWHGAPSESTRAFRLHGRAGTSHWIRVGTVSLLPSHIGTLLTEHTGAHDWQLHLRRTTTRDELELQIASDRPEVLSACATLASRLCENIPPLAAACRSNHVQIRVRVVPLHTLATHPRSGKRMQVVDHRHTMSQHVV
ncbi:phenylacetate--CoA ligase family protein [Burkholderia stagnalis]|uniref:phenylacetate--CoA ligase family protein n=3 Tax=Burkholderia cepacia complex TaxID=87882 RepID=UPI000AD4FB8E|nr:AMP-binding protein [Burkholderia stagnalis]